MDQEARRIFGDWSPPQARGIMEFQVTVRAEVAGAEIHKQVTARRLFKMQMAPCPEAVAEVMGSGVGSLVHVNPVELGRSVRSWRGAAPPESVDEPEAASGESTPPEEAGAST